MNPPTDYKLVPTSATPDATTQDAAGQSPASHLPLGLSAPPSGGPQPGGPNREAPNHRTVDLDDGWTLRVCRTDWPGQEDDLTEAVTNWVGELRPQDTVLISEKVAVMTTGGTEDKDLYAPGPLANLLVRFVRPRPGSRGISVPEKMEFLVRHVGAPRLLAACAASAVTRPFGLRGMFYRVAGPLSRDLDGGRPPFEHLLFPPLTEPEARIICQDLQHTLGCGVAIVDINDFGGSVRGRSSMAPAMDDIFRLLRDNPMGQRDQRTPLAVLMPPEY